MVSNAGSESQWCNHPGFKVYGVQSYIGVPLYRRDGSIFGTLCALDTVPVELSDDHLQTFHLLANLVAFEMEAEERRLQQQQELERARENTKIRDQFIGVLGHDLRNPLNAITVAAAVLLEDKTLSEENSMLAGVIRESARRMAGLIENTLDLTRSQVGGGIRLSPSPNDFGEVCLQVINELRVGHAARDIIFEERGDGRHYFDESRAAQAISNLLSNALQHGAPREPVRLTLRTEETDIFIDVHNFGAPIPEEKHDTLFDPFKRGAVPSEEAMQPQGLGLGLYITREILRAHGGDISLKPDENGNTFSTRWPRRSAD